MTHADLVLVAARWLRRTKHCSVVLTETMSAAGEIPDAIGFQASHSILVECKVSRADLRRDQDKCCERADRRMGWYRFYLVPVDLVASAKELATAKSWGVLSYDGRRVRTALATEYRQPSAASLRNEMALLVSVLRRYQAQGITYQKLIPRTYRERREQFAEHERDVHEARQIMGLEPRGV